MRRFSPPHSARASVTFKLVRGRARDARREGRVRLALTALCTLTACGSLLHDCAVLASLRRTLCAPERATRLQSRAAMSSSAFGQEPTLRLQSQLRFSKAAVCAQRFAGPRPDSVPD